MLRPSRAALLLIGDLLLINISYIFALLLRHDFDAENLMFIGYLNVFLKNAVWIMLIKVAVFWLFGFYRGRRSCHAPGALKSVLLCALGAMAGVALMLTLSMQLLPRSAQLITFGTDLLWLGLTRLLLRPQAAEGADGEGAGEEQAAEAAEAPREDTLGSFDRNAAALLARAAAEPDLTAIGEELGGRIVLVTGAGGSIGAELCRQIACFRPRRLVALDIYENSLFDLANELSEQHPELRLETAVASVRDGERLRELFARHTPHVVFHAAAHKHVPLMEENPREAVLNNALGTKLLMDLAEEFAAERFLLVSTNKAERPASVMGASKRLAEMLLQEKSRTSRCIFAAVRFGNVLGSNGSVLTVFQRQIAAGGPVTVSHPKAERYFLSIPDAAALLLQASAMAEGGEIFMLDMGEPMKILDLAEKLIRLSGKTPYEDVEIAFTGLRPGEKLRETAEAGEAPEATAHRQILLEHPAGASPALQALLQTPGAWDALPAELRGMTEAEVLDWLRRMVPEYRAPGARGQIIGD